MKDHYEHCVKLLEERGVAIKDIAECAYFLQKDYISDLTPEMMESSVIRVLKKNEVQCAIMTAVEFDKCAERGLLEDKELEDMLRRDEGLYGVDEVLAYGICNEYGSIALTNFGYIDKKKYGIIDKLNREGKGGKRCTTFIDDIVGAIAASAASRYVHRYHGDLNED